MGTSTACLRAQTFRGVDDRAELREVPPRMPTPRWGADYPDQHLAVAKDNGAPIHPRTFSQSFQRIIRRAGLGAIRLHDVLHTHASLALNAGVPV
jgi:hypothetical protein